MSIMGELITRGCENKVKLTLDEAKAEIRRPRPRSKPRQNYYLCANCGAWHIGRRHRRR